jgi:ATP-dependent DNA ligase
MVAKRLDSGYFGGRTRAWLKIKTSAGREKRCESAGRRGSGECRNLTLPAHLGVESAAMKALILALMWFR